MTNQQTLTSLIEGIADETRRLTGTSSTLTLAQMETALNGVFPGFDYRGLSGVKFAGNTSDTSIDLSTLDTSNFTSMRMMFSTCSALTSLDLSNFDTSSVTHMANMFDSCSALTSLDLSSFDTSNVISMGTMFNKCSALTTLDLSSFDTSNNTNMNNMFDTCSALTSLNLQSFTTGRVAYMGNMIKGCTNLTDMIWAIDSTTFQALKAANGWDKVSGTVPTDLNIWVRDSLLNDYKTGTNTARYSSCFQKVSELPAALQTLYNIDPDDYQ